MRAFRGPVLALATFVAVGGAVLGSSLAPKEAQASVSIAASFEELVKNADAVAVVTPLEHTSVWEDGRIYTYTHVKADQGVAGEFGAGADGWVRTRGGVVGRVGQLVDGEAVLTPGKSSLLFLRKFKQGGTWEVIERAQGQFPVIENADANATDAKSATTRRTLRVSANVGVLLPRKSMTMPLTPSSSSQGSVTPQSTTSSPSMTVRLASDVLHARSLEEASREIADTWKKLHPATPSTK